MKRALTCALAIGAASACTACTTRVDRAVMIPAGDFALGFLIDFGGDGEPLASSPAFDPQQKGSLASLPIDDQRDHGALLLFSLESLRRAVSRIDAARLTESCLILRPGDPCALEGDQRRLALPPHTAIPEQDDPAFAAGELIVPLTDDPCPAQFDALVPWGSDALSIHRWASARGGDGSIYSVLLLSERSALVGTASGVVRIGRGRDVEPTIVADGVRGDQFLPVDTGPFAASIYGGMLVDPELLLDGRAHVYLVGSGTVSPGYGAFAELAASDEGIDWLRTVRSSTAGSALVAAAKSSDGELALVDYPGRMYRWREGGEIERAFGSMHGPSYDYRLRYTGDPVEPLLVSGREQMFRYDGSTLIEETLPGGKAQSLLDMQWLDGVIYGIGDGGTLVRRVDRRWELVPLTLPKSFSACASGTFPEIEFAKKLRHTTPMDGALITSVQECTALLRIRADGCASPITRPEGVQFTQEELQAVDGRFGMVLAGGDRGLLLVSQPTSR